MGGEPYVLSSSLPGPVRARILLSEFRQILPMLISDLPGQVYGKKPVKLVEQEYSPTLDISS